MTDLSTRPEAAEEQLLTDSEVFWRACENRVLQIQRCDDCGTYRFPPANRCSACWGKASTWATVSGNGTVYTYTVMRRAYKAAFADRIPYIVAIVELDEGVRMVSNLVDCAPDDARVGLPVEVTFGEAPGGETVPMFRPRWSMADTLAAKGEN